jgi:hypothetical protein
VNALVVADLIIKKMTETALPEVKNVSDAAKKIIFESDVKQNARIVVVVMIETQKVVQLMIASAKIVDKLDILHIFAVL